MVRFDSYPPTDEHSEKSRRAAPNYFSRSQQYRLLVMIFLLLLVLFLMAEAAKPRNWQWMWQLARGSERANEETIDAVHWNGGRTPGTGVGDYQNADNVDEVVDTRLSLPERTSHPPGVFVAVTDTPTNGDVATDKTSQDIVNLSHGADGVVTQGDGDMSKVVGIFPGASLEQLQTIRDDTVFRRAETDAWFHWCGLLPAAEEIQPAAPQVTFLQLFRQPDQYRGRLVRVSGLVRRAHRVTAQPNDHGITHFYQCWLFPDEVGGNPIVIYTLHLPDGFPTGMGLHEDVAFTGLFFKRWAYQAKGGIMTAPLVLAASGAWTPSSLPTPTRVPSLPWIIAALGLSAAVGGGVSWFVYQQSNAPGAPARGNGRRDLPDKAPEIASDASTKE